MRTRKAAASYATGPGTRDAAARPWLPAARYGGRRL